MVKFEVLAYAPNDIRKFDDFVVNGLKGPDGKPLRDEYDREITGVMKWLQGRGITKARFFSSDLKDPVPLQFFAAVILPLEGDGEEEVPWMKKVPGFERMVRTDGLVGKLDDYPSGDFTPLTPVFPRRDLDDLYHKENNEIAALDFSGLDFSREEFLLALQGKQGTDLRAMLSQIHKTFKTHLMESFL